MGGATTTAVAPLYRHRNRCRSRRLDPTAVAHGVAKPTAVAHDGRFLRAHRQGMPLAVGPPLWPRAVGLPNSRRPRRLSYSFDKFRNDV